MYRTSFAAAALAMSFAATGCGDSLEADQDISNFTVVHGDDETSATLHIAGEFVWWRNHLPAEDYRLWTSDGSVVWQPVVTRSELVFRQNDSQYWLAAHLKLTDNHSLDYANLEFGWGWRAVGLGPGQGKSYDMAEVGFVEAGDLSHIDTSGCDMEASRILVSTSSYPGTEEELWERADASAESQGLQPPRSWNDVVMDPVMYEFLFGEHKTFNLRNATFAFTSIQMDPLCGDHRLLMRAETGMAGPVTLVD